jgi:hypothetical protein
MLGEPLRALRALASGYPLHHAHIFASRLYARGSAAIPLATRLRAPEVRFGRGKYSGGLCKQVTIFYKNSIRIVYFFDVHEVRRDKSRLYTIRI